MDNTNIDYDFYDDEDSVGFDPFFDENEDDIFDDDICCWDIRYKHGDYCHCAAQHESERRAEHWFYSRYDTFVSALVNFRYYSFPVWISRIQGKWKKRECYNCNQKSTHRQFRSNNEHCPK